MARKNMEPMKNNGLYTPPTGPSTYESPIAPAPQFPERVPTFYEGKMAQNAAGQQGPARFYEGLASDVDLPNEFSNGVTQGYITSPGRPNHNQNVYEKWPAETMQERAHVGSAAWPEAPTYLAEFAHGTDTELAERKFEQVDRGMGYGQRYQRRSPAEVMD